MKLRIQLSYNRVPVYINDCNLVSLFFPLEHAFNWGTEYIFSVEVRTVLDIINGKLSDNCYFTKFVKC